MKKIPSFKNFVAANMNQKAGSKEDMERAKKSTLKKLMAAKTPEEQEFYKRKKKALDEAEDSAKIKKVDYESHTAYGFKGKKVLARRSASSAGGDGGGNGGDGGSGNGA